MIGRQVLFSEKKVNHNFAKSHDVKANDSGRNEDGFLDVHELNTRAADDEKGDIVLRMTSYDLMTTKTKARNV